MNLAVQREFTHLGASSIRRRFDYFQRIFAAYLTDRSSQLTFWHEDPELNLNMRADKLGEYYMPFLSKADYSAHLDQNGIPLLNYRGRTGLQYNPIAIAQYGLGNYNLWVRTADRSRRDKFLLSADWLLTNLQQNAQGLYVWEHLFDWEYRTLLRAPWYSGLAQGQGISLLLRAHKETANSAYLDSAELAFRSLLAPVESGGVLFIDDHGDKWFEEYVVHPAPPTHILNGFMWATWGVWDYHLATGSPRAHTLFTEAAQTLKRNIAAYDCGYWSLYEQSGTRVPMIASHFYHRLHIVQLRVMYALTRESLFAKYADRWHDYTRSRYNRARALAQKALFKVVGY